MLTEAENQLGEAKEDMTDLRERNNNLLTELVASRKENSGPAGRPPPRRSLSIRSIPLPEANLDPSRGSKEPSNKSKH